MACKSKRPLNPDRLVQAGDSKNSGVVRAPLNHDRKSTPRGLGLGPDGKKKVFGAPAVSVSPAHD
jgi:hypothetical protein